MDDLISRAAAIEAIGERPLNWTDTPGELQAISDWDCDIAAIKSVPAVDAIPVEWLRQYAPEKWSMYMQAEVEIIIEAWQKEQEART